MSAIWYRYKDLPRIAAEEKLPGLDVWCSIYRVFIEVLDERSGSVRTPISTVKHPSFALPPVRAARPMSFESCCEARTEELLRDAEESDRPLYVLFSGGIDSTTVLSAFLKFHPLERLRGRIKIVTSTEAWVENPGFMREHLVGTFELLPFSGLASYCDGRAVLVTGEMNDYYVPNSQYRRLGERAGKSLSYNTELLYQYLLAAPMPESHARRWCEVLDADWQRSPVYSDSFETFLWWVRFNWTRRGYTFLTFISVDLAAAGVSSFDTYNDRIRHFFNSDEFQRWGMANTDRSPRKNHCRALIASFFSDKDWVEQKQKFSSLRSTLALKRLPLAFDASFRPQHTKEELLSHYDAGNDFVI